VVNLRLSIGKETSANEEKELLMSFAGIDIKIDNGTIRLGEEDLPMIISFFIGTIASGASWDLIKLAVQRLRQKEGVEIKREIVQNITYKNETIIITKDSVVRKNTSIKITSIEQAINEIDKNT